MKVTFFRRFFILLLKIFTVGIALLMIPLTLLVSVFSPGKGIVSFLLFVLPVLLFIFWVIRMILCGRLHRQESPFSFYTVIIASALFWLVFSGISANVFLKKTDVYQRRLRPKELIALATDVLNNMYKIEAQRATGLFLKENQKRLLFREYARFSLSTFFPFLSHKNDLRILHYHVKGYNVYDTGWLFREIFIQQQYFFRPDAPAPLIIDCGSHIGLSILYFKALYPNAQVLGFEPAPETFKLLRENVKRNRLENVRLENKAVSNDEGTMEFYGDESNTSSLLKERGSKNSTKVEVVKLSKYIERKVDFLKIDVEGVEDLVLENLAAEKKLGLIQQMVIEYHHHIAKDVDRLSKFLKMLEDHNFGYQIEGHSPPPYRRMEYEDVMIYAYQK